MHASEKAGTVISGCDGSAWWTHPVGKLARPSTAGAWSPGHEGQRGFSARATRHACHEWAWAASGAPARRRAWRLMARESEWRRAMEPRIEYGKVAPGASEAMAG